MKTKYMVIFFLSLIFLIQSDDIYGQNIPVSVFCNGGGQIQSDNYQIVSTIGQSTTGMMQSPDFQKNIGFWYQAEFSEDPPNSIEDLEDMPNEFTLDQNYPNPFNPSTQIRFAIPAQAHVNLNVYNLLGQQVATLVNETRSPGWHTVTFDASGLSSGVFIYRLEAGEFVETKQMLFVK